MTSAGQDFPPEKVSVAWRLSLAAVASAPEAGGTGLTLVQLDTAHTASMALQGSMVRASMARSSMAGAGAAGNDSRDEKSPLPRGAFLS